MYGHSVVWTWLCGHLCEANNDLIGWNDCQGEGIMAHNSLQLPRGGNYGA